MMNKEERQLQKVKIRERIEADRQESKRIRTLTGDEKKAAKRVIKETLKSDKKESKEQKLFLNKVKRVRRRPVTLSIWGVVILLPVTILMFNFIQAIVPMPLEIQEARAAAEIVAAKVQGEGSVLLLNKDNVLPLTKEKINIFGTRSVTPSYGGGGSGSINSADALTFYQALENAGIETNRELYDLYANWRFKGEVSTKSYNKKDRKSFFEMILPNIFGIMGTERYEKLDAQLIPRDIISRAREFSDTALISVGSFSRETLNDTKYTDKDPETLTISVEDRKHLELLNREFENVIVLVNTGNVMEMNWIEDYENIKAVLWIGYPGAVGFSGVAGLLSGEENPSGRLTDTIPYDLLSAPATKLVGHYPYENLENQAFINYNEGIYIGYRFYESYYSGDEQAYEKAVQFPFGYGLSYSSFDWEPAEFSVSDERVAYSVKVTNTGDFPGKDVIQVYYSAPYYTDSGIEKSVINLVDYAKTDKLAPGESQVLTIDFPISDMASYDYKGKEAWVLEAGKYEIKLARNVHDIAQVRTFDLIDDIVFKIDEVTGTEINNLFEDADGGLDYLSRNNFDRGIDAMDKINSIAPQSVMDAIEYTVTEKSGDLPVFNAENNLLLEDLKGLTFDDPQWELFLDQFKLKEMIEIVADGGWKSMAVKRLGIPETLHYDGPASIRHYFGKWSTIGFPNAGIVAQTWNDDLQLEMARAMTYEGVLRGIDIWYAPAMNIHRTPLGSRNFEYFSEDPVISGRAATAMVNGAHANGMGVTLKHFAVYTQETNRTGSFNWMNEQALREIYLKPFEMSVKEGGAYGVMTAMTRIGHDWCGHNSTLLNDLLRNEWGFRGFAVTDITIGEYMKAYDSITNGNDLMLSMHGNFSPAIFSGSHAKNLKEAYEIDPVGTASGLRSSAKNILYMVLQTNEMK